MESELLDVVVRQSAAILQLLASKDKTLLVWGNAFFILNEVLPSSANDEVRCDCTFADDGNTS